MRRQKYIECEQSMMFWKIYIPGIFGDRYTSIKKLSLLLFNWDKNKNQSKEIWFLVARGCNEININLYLIPLRSLSHSHLNWPTSSLPVSVIQVQFPSFQPLALHVNEQPFWPAPAQVKSLLCLPDRPEMNIFSKIMPNFCRPHAMTIHKIQHLHFIDKIKLTFQTKVEVFKKYSSIILTEYRSERQIFSFEFWFKWKRQNLLSRLSDL